MTKSPQPGFRSRKIQLPQLIALLALFLIIGLLNVGMLAGWGYVIWLLTGQRLGAVIVVSVVICGVAYLLMRPLDQWD